MDLPSRETRAPSPPAIDLADVSEDVSVLSITSKTRHLDRLNGLRAITRLWMSGVQTEQLSLLSSAALRALVLHTFRGEDLKAARRLTSLQSLVIWDAPRLRSLEGVEHLNALNQL